jgi:hypothetical protein
MAHVHVPPAAAVGVLEDTGQADVADDRVPVQREDQIAETLVVDDAGHVVLIGQDQRLRTGDAEAGGQGGVEELVVRGPHEWVVDDGDPLQHGVLQVAAVVGDLVRDAVDEDDIRARLVHGSAAEADVLGDHALVPPVDGVDERRREGPLATDQQADFQHSEPC